jgi:hypothetical protein
MIALITFGHTIGITAVGMEWFIFSICTFNIILAFVREKLDGTLDRIYAAGVTSATSKKLGVWFFLPPLTMLQLLQATS